MKIGRADLKEKISATHAYLAFAPDGSAAGMIHDNLSNAVLIEEKKRTWEAEGFRVEYLQIDEARYKMLNE